MKEAVRGSWFAVAVCSILLGSPPALGVGFQDTIGDSPFREHDLARCEAEVTAGVLEVTLGYAGELGLLALNWGTLFLDTDLNPDTPTGPWELGADCVIRFQSGRDYAAGFVELGGELFDLGGRGTSIASGPDAVTIRLPLALWGGSAAVRLFAGSSWSIGDASFDRVPDTGWLDASSGLVVIPRPGDERVQIRLADSEGDATFPDLTYAEVGVRDGNLQLRLTFAHGVERADLQSVQDILVVHVSMDTDHRLWTGFRNDGEQPPSFGIDRSLDLMFSHVFDRPSGSIRRKHPDDPTTPADDLSNEMDDLGPLGSQDNDTRFIVGRDERFGTAPNQIYVCVPLAYLGYDEGEMLLRVTAFLETTTGPGHYDVLPDSGALDTRLGLGPQERVRPVAACAGLEVLGEDNPNDSREHGYQGDEIVRSRACVLDDGGLRIQVELEALELSDLAFVNLFVDADGSAATGLPMHNGTAETLGVDFTLGCSVAATPDPTLVITTLMDHRSPPLGSGLHRVDQLVAVRLGGTPGSGVAGGGYSITLPAELLQSPPGAHVRYGLITARSYYTLELKPVWMPLLEEYYYGSMPLGQDDPFNKADPIPGSWTPLDYAPATGFFQVSAPPPAQLAVRGVVPNSGPIAGGNRVTLYGTGFARNPTVTWGDVPVPPGDVRFKAPGELSVILPAHAAGTVPVSVTVPGGPTALKPDAYSYGPPVVAAPVVTGTEPSLGPTAGGNVIQIQGANFLPGATVRIGGQAASAMAVESPYSIRLTAPAGTTGPADVMVTSPDGKTGVLSGGYNYGSRPPAIWTFFPDFGSLAGGTRVTVVGERFKPGATARIGGVPLSGVAVVSENLLTGFTAPGQTAGPQPVTVVNADGVSGGAAATFQCGGTDPGFASPQILAATPMSSPPTGGVEVTILGTGFQPGVAVLLDQAPVRVQYADSLMIRIIAPPHGSGLVEIRVTNPDGKSAALPPDQAWNSFSYDSDEPWIMMADPMGSPTSGGQSVTLIGSNFRPGVRVEFGDFPGVVTDASPVVLTVLTPPHPPGPVNIRVINPSGLEAVYEGDIIFGRFIYQGGSPPPPAISSATPAESSVYGGQSVSLTGRNFFAGARVFFGGAECAEVVLVSATSLRATVPPGALGTVDIVVRNADHQEAPLAAAFTYVTPTPVVTALTPRTGPALGGTVVTLTGDGFLLDSEVRLGGLPVADVSLLDRTRLTLKTPPGLPGPATLTVINRGGRSASLAQAFTYQGTNGPPLLFNLFPSRGPAAGGTAIELSGKGFLPGATVTIHGQPLSQIVVASPGAISAVVPPGSPGAFDLVVQNADGQFARAGEAFTYVDPSAPAPELLSLTPARGPAHGGTEVVLRGRHFQPGARVSFGQQPATERVFVSAGEIRARSAAATPGVCEVVVTNPDDREGRLPQGFLYEGAVGPPQIASIRCDGQRVTLVLTNLTPSVPHGVERSFALGPADWIPVSTFAPASSETNWSEPLGNGSPRAFYRLSVTAGRRE